MLVSIFGLVDPNTKFCWLILLVYCYNICSGCKFYVRYINRFENDHFSEIPVLFEDSLKTVCNFSIFLPASANFKFPPSSATTLATSSTTNWPVKPVAPNTTKSYLSVDIVICAVW